MLAGMLKSAEHLRVPLALDDVVEQCARGIGHIGDVVLAAGEMPDEPAIDGAEGELAALGAGACAGHIVENPRDLGRGEVGIEDQAGLCETVFASAAGFEARAMSGGAAVLPDDGVMDGLAGCALPDDDGFALVGDADGGNIAGARAGFAEGFNRAESVGW